MSAPVAESTSPQVHAPTDLPPMETTNHATTEPSHLPTPAETSSATSPAIISELPPSSGHSSLPTLSSSGATPDALSPIQVAQTLPADLPSASGGVLPVVEMTPLDEEYSAGRLTAAQKGKGKSVEVDDPLTNEQEVHPSSSVRPFEAPVDHHEPSLSGEVVGATGRLSLSQDHTSPPSHQQHPDASPIPLDAATDREEEWLLKSISWPPLPPPPSLVDHTGPAGIEEGPRIKIISQNANGPCSLIALCNILILRGDIHITPPTRNSVSYSYLSSLVADHLLATLGTSSAPPSTTDDSLSPSEAEQAPSIDLSSALSILPSTRYGLDLNPRFGSIDGFRALPGTAAGNSGELALFQLSKIPLLHGWVVDPQEAETWDVMVEKVGDYDTAVENVVVGEVISGGLEEDGEGVTGKEEEIIKKVEARSKWSKEEEEKVREAYIIKAFLSATRTQLTYHGLFLLSSHLAPSSLSALFRNSHLSVLYRRPILPSPLPPSSPTFDPQSHPAPQTGPQLFTLVTDSSFVNEPEVVWESLEDVDGSASEFYDGALRRSAVRGGDWVGRQRRSSRPVEREQYQDEDWESRDQERTPMPHDDFALAQQLQHEEDENAQRHSELERRDRRARRDEEERRQRAATKAPTVLQPGTLSAGSEAVSGSGSGRRVSGGKEKLKKEKEKDKCTVM